jgi:fructokinase
VSFSAPDLRVLMVCYSYGFITNTPKVGWKDCDILGTIRGGLGIECAGFDTDVNAAALAMASYFSQQKEGDEAITSLAYATVGTGVGVGILSHGQLVHGKLHPEAGHV